MRPGPRNLITDVPGILVGNAEDHTLKSGVTVLTGESPLTASVEVMGGAPGTRETDLLAPHNIVEEIHAITLSGGSAFGLDAASGAQAALREAGRGYRVGNAVIPIVPGAIIFDLLNGGNRNRTDNPYGPLGRRALENAGQEFSLGTAGAGTGALAAQQKGGLGSASLVIPSGHTVGALVAANPVGSVTTPGSDHFWAAPLEIDGEFGDLGPDPRAGLIIPDPSRKAAAMGWHQPGTSTTIAVVATDAPLTKAEAKRLAVASHDGIARAVQPAHTPHDGDLVFAVSIRKGPGGADLITLGHAAATCLARAIARAVYLATPTEGDIVPAWSENR
ncbi:MAG: P1 family peptidase [Rhodobacteraceae bacterium]|nr:P1 family peptidase [Paracoccaceae bacterium]